MRRRTCLMLSTWVLFGFALAPALVCAQTSFHSVVGIPNPSVYGATITFRAIVNGIKPLPPPEGQVTFSTPSQSFPYTPIVLCTGDLVAGAPPSSSSSAVCGNQVILPQGTYTITADYGALSTSFSHVVSPGQAPKLVFMQQPGTGTAGDPLSPAIQVALVDSKGDLLTADPNSVSLSVTGPGPFDGSSQTTATLNAGIATFNNLIFDKAGSGYVLTASDSAEQINLRSSSPFEIVASYASGFGFTTQPPATILQGNRLGTVAVTEQDRFGNQIHGSTDPVHFTLPDINCHDVDFGSVAMVDGVAALDIGLRLYTAQLHLIVDAEGRFGQHSNAFDVTAPNPDLIFGEGFEVCRP